MTRLINVLLVAFLLIGLARNASAEETFNLLDAPLGKKIALSGGHHFSGKYVELTQTILQEIHVLP
ncbi:MAG: hypothetical protein AB7P69_24225 [Candidatus Binatia bacterium]